LPSIGLPWTDIKSYRAAVGPGIGRPPRPTACLRCPCGRIWYDGWRHVFSVVLAEDSEPLRFDEPLPLQRVACARCFKSWTLWPRFVYPRRQFAPDVNEAAALAYLSDPSATYVKVAARFSCSWTSVWRWVGWLSALVAPEQILGAIARSDRELPALGLVPRAVVQDHEKAYSDERAEKLLRALKALVLLCLLTRVLRFPPVDPSPLRWLLWVQLIAGARPIALVEGIRSPAFHIDHRGPPDP